MRSAIVQVLRRGDQAVVGAGVLCEGGLIFTCAHVVAYALGHRGQVARPNASIAIRFPFRDSPHSGSMAADVVGWIPGDGTSGGDIAILESPNVGSDDWASIGVHRFGSEVAALGFPHDGSGGGVGQWVSGTVGEVRTDNYVQVEGRNLAAYWFRPGFSGTPVWDTQRAVAVGIAAAADSDPHRQIAYLIPAAALVQAAKTSQSQPHAVDDLVEAFNPDRLAEVKRHRTDTFTSLTVAPGAFEALANELETGELVRFLATAASALTPGGDFVPWLIAASDRRLLYVFKIPFGRLVIRHHRYQDLHRVTYKPPIGAHGVYPIPESLRLVPKGKKPVWLTHVYPRRNGPAIAEYAARRITLMASGGLFARESSA
ncbi:serine protease [Actinoplanes sp. Pm04-4]|uniref:Serine protease n=1 Tax=Paractinoplanes pyxinae TaxID=2997416 RepID=A0ABT4B3A8_9ACTN|nr:serine protease [Actinoplanes pyxinae]MCY1140988.1 serine protease [Actinoplanes pyxinae]